MFLDPALSYHLKEYQDKILRTCASWEADIESERPKKLKAPNWPKPVEIQQPVTSHTTTPFADLPLDDEDDMPPVVEDEDDFIDENEIDDAYALFLGGEGNEEEPVLDSPEADDQSGGFGGGGCIIT